MVVQGLAPSFWCAFSDSMGRRPIMIATFVVYLAANIGLAFVKNFAGFMVLRGVQAAGSAATISIGTSLCFEESSRRLIANRRWRYWRYYNTSGTWWTRWRFWRKFVLPLLL